MIKVKDGYAKLIGTTYSGSADRVLLSNGGDFGLHTGRNNEVNKIVRTDASGYIQAGWINTTSGDMGTTAATRIYCSNDGFIRYKTPANFFSVLTNSSNQLSITVGDQNRKVTVAYATNSDTVDGLHASDFKRTWDGYAGKTYIGWIKIIEWTITNANHFSPQSFILQVYRSYNSPSPESYTLAFNFGWNSANIVQLNSNKGARIIENFRVTKTADGLKYFVEMYVNTSYTTYQNTCYFAIGNYRSFNGSLVCAVQSETVTELCKITTSSNNIVAPGYVKQGSSDSYVLLGGGGHKTIASFQTTYDGRYVKKAGDTMTGTLTMSTGAAIHLWDDSATASHRLTLRCTSDIGRIYNYTGSAYGAMYIGYDGTNAIVVTSGQNVGIGTGSPADKFHVNGGYVRIVANGKYLKIGPQNATHAHYETDATTSHWFNKRVEVNGHVNPYSNNSFASGTSDKRWSNVYSVLGNFTGAITSSLTTSTHINGNKGTAIINSTAAAGYNMLAKMNSTNGVFNIGTYNASFNLYYTTKTIIDAGTNSTTYGATLLNESGNSSFPGQVSVNTLKITSTSAVAHIAFSRGNYNYISAPTGGSIGFCVNGNAAGTGANCEMVISDGAIFPGTTNVTSLGDASHYWTGVYAHGFYKNGSSNNYALTGGGGHMAIHTGRNNEANKLVRTDGNGYLQTGWINTTSGNMNTTAITKIYCSNDDYIRYKTPANFFETLANDGNQISITVGSQNRKLTVNYASFTKTLDNIGLPSSTSNAANTAWCKFARITFNNAAWSTASGYLFFGGGENPDNRAILVYHFRASSTATTLSTANLHWLVKSYSDATVIAVKVSDNVYDLYTNNSGTYMCPRIYHMSAFSSRFAWSVGSWTTTKPTAAYTSSDIGRVYYATNAGSATQVIVNQHTTNNTEYPMVWSNSASTSTTTGNQLYKSYSHLTYNPSAHRISTGQYIANNSAGPHFTANSASGSWAYMRLNNSTCYWDIATTNSSSYVASSLWIGRYNGGNTGIVITTGGNVGIGTGTTAPSQRLHVSGNAIATNFGVNSSGGGNGISLYNGSGNVATYGIAFNQTSNWSTHGYVTSDWATYFTMNNQNNRGWIFRRNGSGNVFSIDTSGQVYANGRINGNYFTSRVATGTQPYACTSTTLNTNLNADLLDGQHGSRYTQALGGPNYITITVGGDAATYYPVVISSVSSYYPMQFVNISRTYSETAPDSWNTATHKGGLTLTLLWNGSRYWDGNGNGGPCSVVYVYQSYCTMVGGFGNSTAGKVVWLRGGGATYHIHAMNGTSVSATVYTSTYTDSASQSFAPRTTVASYSVRWPGYAQGADKLGSSTVGGTYQPIYLSSGTATAGTSYAKAIKSITRSGTTFTYTCIDGTTGTFTQQDNNTDTKVTNTLSTTTKFYVTGTSSATTNTGTQYFDTGVYVSTTAGQLCASTLTATYHTSTTTLYLDSASSTSILFRIGGTEVARFAQPTGHLTLAAQRQILRAGNSASWYQGRSHALLYQNSYTGYNPCVAMKTTNGVWALGVYSSDTVYMTYVTDTNYNAGTNTATYQITFPKASGTLALTSQIPSVGNGTVTIKQAGATKGSFTMNQSGNTTIELTDNNTTYYVYGKTINASYKTAYRTQTGRASGYYLAAIRCDTASVAEAPQYGSGIAFGMADTHGYLYMNYSSAYAYIGAGNADKLNWTATLLHSSNSSVSGGGSAWGSSITVKINNTTKTLTIPANPNTDTKVTQSSTTTTSYRPIVLGYTSSATAGSGMDTSTTNQVYVSNKFYACPSTGYLYATSMQASSWFRSTGNTGWYSSTYGGGIYMTDTTWVRVYNSKSFYVPGNTQIDGTLYLYRTTDAAATTDNRPALVVGGAATAAHIEMDSNEIIAKTNGTTISTLYLNSGGAANTVRITESTVGNTATPVYLSTGAVTSCSYGFKGSYTNPVIVWCGYAYRTYSSTSWSLTKSGGWASASLSVSNANTYGYLQLSIPSCVIYGAFCSTMSIYDGSDKYASSTTTTTGRSSGMGDYQTYCSGTSVYIKKFNQGDQNNDTWRNNGLFITSTSDGNKPVTRFYIMVIGYYSG